MGSLNKSARQILQTGLFEATQLLASRWCHVSFLDVNAKSLTGAALPVLLLLPRACCGADPGKHCSKSCIHAQQMGVAETLRLNALDNNIMRQEFIYLIENEFSQS